MGLRQTLIIFHERVQTGASSTGNGTELGPGKCSRVSEITFYVVTSVGVTAGVVTFESALGFLWAEVDEADLAYV